VGGETLSFYIGEAVDEVLYLIRNSAIGACVCLLELAIGIFLIMYFIIGNKGIRIENYVLYFGLFAVLMGAWSLNETVLMALLVKNTVAGSNLGYILIMLMPAPFAMFVQGFLMPEDKWAAGSITFLSVLNMAACVLLHMTGILKNVIDPAAHLSSGIKKPCTNIAKGAGISMIKIYPRLEPATVFLTRSAISTVSFKDHAPISTANNPKYKT
jgi:hypothetical protein